MKNLTHEQIENMAAIVVGLFNMKIEIGTIREMFFAYVNSEGLIETGTEDWPEELIDNYNGGGYKTTHGGAKAIYDDLYREHMESQIRLELQD